MAVRMTGNGLLSITISAAALVAIVLPACSSADPAPGPPAPAQSTAPPVVAPPAPERGIDQFDVPIAQATAAEREMFLAGDRMFETPLRDADGLGPLYTRTSCGACHVSGA